MTMCKNITALAIGMVALFSVSSVGAGDVVIDTDRKSLVVSEICLNGLAFAVIYSGGGRAYDRGAGIVQIMIKQNGIVGLAPKTCDSDD